MQNCHNFQEELPLMSPEEISQWLLNESVLFYSGQAAGLTGLFLFQQYSFAV